MPGSVSDKRGFVSYIIIGVIVIALAAAFLYAKMGEKGGVKYKSSNAEGQLRGFLRLETPKKLPEINFTDLEGKPLKLADWHGRVVLLNIWATWCPPCRAEMPTLDRLEQELGGDDFEVVALSVDKGGPLVPQKFLKKQNLAALKVYNDKDIAVRRKLGLRGYPTTLLIDRQGREVGRLAGPAEWDSEEAKKLMREIIAQK